MLVRKPPALFLDDQRQCLQGLWSHGNRSGLEIHKRLGNREIVVKIRQQRHLNWFDVGVAWVREKRGVARGGHDGGG